MTVADARGQDQLAVDALPLYVALWIVAGAGRAIPAVLRLIARRSGGHATA